MSTASIHKTEKGGEWIFWAYRLTSSDIKHLNICIKHNKIKAKIKVKSIFTFDSININMEQKHKNMMVQMFIIEIGITSLYYTEHIYQVMHNILRH